MPGMSRQFVKCPACGMTVVLRKDGQPAKHVCNSDGYAERVAARQERERCPYCVPDEACALHTETARSEDHKNSDQGDTGRRDGEDRHPSTFAKAPVVPERRAADLSPARSSQTHDGEEGT